VAGLAPGLRPIAVPTPHAQVGAGDAVGLGLEARHAKSTTRYCDLPRPRLLIPIIHLVPPSWAREWRSAYSAELLGRRRAVKVR